MNLVDTVELMLSDNYEDRFKAEYYQLRERYNRLSRMVVKYEAETLDFEPKCSLLTLKKQLDAMRTYAYLLEVRAQIEGIIL